MMSILFECEPSNSIVFPKIRLSDQNSQPNWWRWVFYFYFSFKASRREKKVVVFETSGNKELKWAGEVLKMEKILRAPSGCNLCAVHLNKRFVESER